MIGQRTFLPALAAGACVLAAVPAGAQPDGEGRDEDNPAEPRLIAEYAGLVPGRTNTVALTFDIETGWHTYWQGQNDTGFAVSAEWSLPARFEAGELLWPAPHRSVSTGGILDYIYEGDEATLLLPVDVPEDAEPGSTVSIKADVEWLVCREACIPGWATVERTFTILDPATTPPVSAGADRIARARRRLPVPIPEGATDIEIRWAGGVLAIDATRPVERIDFLPHESGRAISDPLETATSDTGRLRLRAEPGDAPVRGIVVMDLGDHARPRLYRIETSPTDEDQ